MSFEFAMLSQADEAGGIVVLFVMLVYLAIILALLAGMWKTFEKANQPGWGILIPIYNTVLLLKIAGKPLWWLILMVIPLISIYPAIVIPLAVAKNFRKGTGFGLGLLFLPIIFYPILGFGDAEFDPDEPVF